MISKNMRRTSALAFICVALGELGRLDELNALANHDRLISADQIDQSHGFASLANFNQYLARSLTTQKSLVHAPPAHATQSGFHSGDLSHTKNSDVMILNAVCVRAADERRRLLDTTLDHPFDRVSPRSFSYSLLGHCHERGQPSNRAYSSFGVAQRRLLRGGSKRRSP